MAKEKVTFKRVKKYIPLYVMMIPGLVYLIINNYMPMPGLVIAFKTYSAKKGIYGSPWCGLANFKYLFATSDAWVITRNTILYNIAFIVINTILSIAIAIILSELTSRLKKCYQSAILLPHLLSTVIIAYLVYAFLCVDTGFVNTSILAPLGKNAVMWYTETKYWPFILIFVSAWKSVGYSCIVYLATILGFDRAYYEAATIDGCTKMQQIAKITLPMLKPTIVMLTLMSVGRIFYSDFGLFYQVPMNSGSLYPVTQTIDTYVFRGLLQLGNISMSSAAGVYQSLIGFILVLSANLAVRKIDPESALF